MTPTDVLVRHTMAFVSDALPRTPGRVLEVGAGAGHLARALRHAGHDLVAIDASAKAVARARDLGHAVDHADWHDFEAGGFDAILFTRSLHHIDRLDEAVDRCWTKLVPGGRVILEEFSAADVDEATAHWLRDQLEVLVETGAAELKEGRFLEALLEASDPHAWWHEHHAHLHADADIRNALERGGRVVAADQVPYLYRYFLGVVVGDDGTLLGELLDIEADLITQGTIQPIGRRYVAELRGP